MKRDDIRRSMRFALARLGYSDQHYSWEKPGRLYIVVKDAKQVFAIPSGIPKYKFRAVVASIPRNGPARKIRLVTPDTWQQPSLPFAVAA